jgi:hypothetical protein
MKKETRRGGITKKDRKREKIGRKQNKETFNE